MEISKQKQKHASVCFEYKVISSYSMLSIRNISKEFTNHQALLDVSFEVATGSSYGLVGDY